MEIITLTLQQGCKDERSYYTESYFTDGLKSVSLNSNPLSFIKANPQLQIPWQTASRPFWKKLGINYESQPLGSAATLDLASFFHAGFWAFSP